MKPTRVQSACARCRQQKLKCDDSRPCRPCVRAGAECREAINKRRRKNPPASSTNISHPLLVLTPESPGNILLSSEGHNENSKPERGAASTFRLVEQLFRRHLTVPRHSDAIPDGTTNNAPPPSASRVPVRDVVGISLPAATVTSALLDAYLKASHWYLTLFHELSFRAHTQEILDTDGVTTSEKGFLLLLLAVLVTGARFIDPDAIHIYHPSFDATAFQVRTIAAIENHLILALNDFSLESIAFLLLMSSTYLQMRKVQLAFMVSGMGVRMAQAMGLSEAVWPTVDDLERQVRRRLWWSMYMTDMYTAQAYGKPAILDESHFHVSQPQDLDDTITTCPGFNSLELREENKMHPVTMLSYNRYKSQLYVIAARMTGNMSIQQIQTVMKDLVDWGKALPPELRPGSFVGKEREVMSNPALRVFALQALTLQVTFDNMYLVLFRPFLCSGRSASMVFPDSTSQPLTAPILPGSSIRQQLLESAMRTSNIGRSLEILRLVSRTTAANQVGFHCFTAGVTLGMLALLDLASPRLLELKQALARMINILGIVGAQTPLCGQSIEILTDMIHLIASQEVKHMISRTVSSSTHPGPCNARTEPGAIESGTDIGAGVSESLGQGCDCIQTSAECGDTGETDPWPDLEMLFGEQAFAQLNQIWSYDPIPRGVYE